jgi:hypothetical protein
LLGFKPLGLTGHLQPPHRHITVGQSNAAVSCALSAPFAVSCFFSVLFGPGCHAHPDADDNAPKLRESWEGDTIGGIPDRRDI